MKVISILTIIAAMLYLYLTVTTIKSKQRSNSTWLLAASSFLLMYWTFLAYFTYNAQNIEHIRVLFQVSLSAVFFFLPLQLFFIKSLKSGLTVKFIIFISLPSLFLMIKNLGWDVTFSDFYRDGSVWVFVPATGIWNILWKIYMSVSFGWGLLILQSRYRKTELNREKKQIKLLIASSSLTMVLALGEYYFYPFFSQYWTVPLTPILFLPWVGGYVLAISKYQFLNIIPENITHHILESVDELVVLIDFDGRPTYLNKHAKSFFKDSMNQKKKNSTSIFFLIWTVKKNQLSRLKLILSL